MIKPEYPMPQRERSDWKNLNGQWKFRFFRSIEEEQFFAQNRSEYEHDITVPFAWGAPLSGVPIEQGGVGWYSLDTEYSFNGKLFLCFGGVDYLCDVYVNGKYVCHHQGGYTAFEIDVTEQWKSGLNRIEVRAEDFRHTSQTYGKQDYGAIQGIWQTVWLEQRPASYIKGFHFTTSLDGYVSLEAQILAAYDGHYQLQATFDDQTFTTECSLHTGHNTVLMTLTIAQPRLWSPDNPYLYEGTLTLFDDRNANDCVKTYFGIREISIRPAMYGYDPCITINNKPIFLCGTLDQGYHPQGYFTAPDEADFSGNAYRLKRLGLNMVRFHIKAEEPRRLYWMDKTGILVMQDIPCFWGDPTPEACAAYENEWPDLIRRDWNHPCIFSWVMFNETWGLFTHDGDQKIYLPETQEWVRKIYHQAKQLDPTRLVEDNSPCHGDHVQTDLNTWHVYVHGYRKWKKLLDDYDATTYPGSTSNYIGGNKQASIPLMNSECGMVWGVEGSAGDSDLSWQYHYMLNEFHLHPKQNGFVFTEFRDVINEFNGYYRIDNSDKDWAYDAWCDGMTLRDLHTPLFAAIDAPPCQSVSGGSEVILPLFLANHIHECHALCLRWVLYKDTIYGRSEVQRGEIIFDSDGSALQSIKDLHLNMPNDDTICCFCTALENEDGTIISRNFVNFDVHANLADNCVTLPLSSWKMDGALCWKAMNGEKCCASGHASLSYHVSPNILQTHDLHNCYLIFEASAKRVLEKDAEREKVEVINDLDFFNGYKANRGSFANSYYMTDNTRFPSVVRVWINGKPIDELNLPNDPADVHGILSWQAQGEGDHLDEAGSYGYLCRIVIPSAILFDAMNEGKGLSITLQASGEGGLALYGRGAGRYAMAPSLFF